MKLSALALIIIIISPCFAYADEYFIQMWTSNHKSKKVYVYEGDDPGGIEVFGPNGDTIACQEISTIHEQDGDVLTSFSTGFISKYPLNSLKFMPRGSVKSQLSVQTKETTIK